MAASRVSSRGRLLVHAAWVLAAVCLLVWTASVAFLWVNEARFVFRAHATRGIPASLDDDGFSRARFTAADGVALEGAMLAAPESDHAYWILFAPGAGNSIHFGRVQSQLRQLGAMGYNVLAFDYRGFGQTLGVPSESGLYQDARAAYDYLTVTRRVPPARVILAGRSLGSAVAVELATHVPSAGALLLSPIASVPDTAAWLYPWAPVRLLAANRFDSAAKVARLRVPVVVVHARNDRFVPLAAARLLYSRVTAPKLMLETAGGHTRAGFDDPAALADGLSRFWPIALESPSAGADALGSD